MTMIELIKEEEHLNVDFSDNEQIKSMIFGCIACATDVRSENPEYFFVCADCALFCHDEKICNYLSKMTGKLLVETLIELSLELMQLLEKGGGHEVHD